VVAALTTSVPEHAHSGRNWDYRYCWIRDAYFAIHAFNRLGVTRTMEGFLRYINNIVTQGGRLQPLYDLATEKRLDEREVEGLGGYRGMGPVRVGNQAYEQVQNDVYGSVVLALTQLFFDERLLHPGAPELFEQCEQLGRRALEVWDKPDAGLWELRTRARVHTFSAVMCWAACSRLARIAERLRLGGRSRAWREHADRIHAEICARAWSEERGSFVESFDGEELDASLLLLHERGFLAADDPRFAGTVAAVEAELKIGDFVFRYRAPDDFGEPETAFVICTFWYINALAALGRKAEARELFESMLACRNHLGLLSEDVHPETGELWGNFPQAYSMVGLINAALVLSEPWETAF